MKTILHFFFSGNYPHFFHILLLFSAICMMPCCSGEQPEIELPPEIKPPYIDPKPKEELKPVTDMVLIYGFGAHRGVTWNRQYLKPYVTFTDAGGIEHWLFDGFLFLEFVTGNSPSSRIFAFGYGALPARREEWKALADYYFTPGNAVYALEAAIAEAATRMGDPAKKVKVVICLPQPIPAGPGSRFTTIPADYWGEINGKKINMSEKADRISACSWYIDYVMQLFHQGNFKYVDLAGFYWIAESIDETGNMLPDLAEIINRRNYSFNWIPCWKNQPPNPDFFTWKTHKFTYAYLQPNYFFSDLPLSRLSQACEYADKYDLDLEFEFDHNVLAAFGRTKVYKMYDYMEAFRKKGMLASKKIAYYQGTDVLAQLYFSKDASDNELYGEFCSFVLEHQTLYQK